MNSKLFRGSLDTVIIKLLADNDAMYGYEITQRVKELTAGEFKITEGALYPALHRLEAKGLLDTETKKVDNRFRKYYSLTQSGQKEVNQMMEQMNSFITGLNAIINPKIA